MVRHGVVVESIGGQVLFWLCIWLIGMYVSYCMVGVNRDRASQWTVNMGTTAAKKASPVEDSRVWHFMEWFVWTGGGLQMLGRICTELARMSIPAADREKRLPLLGKPIRGWYWDARGRKTL